MAYQSDKLTCPYDKSHEIERERMQFHLVRCKKNFPNQEIVACSYNNLHRIPKPELPFHHTMCPDKKKLDIFMHDIGDAKSPARDYVDIHKGSVPRNTENWDDEPHQPSALEVIQKQIEEKPVLRALKVSSKAKKKTFHHQERQRMNELIDSTAKLSCASVQPQDVQEKPSSADTALSGNTARRYLSDESVAGSSDAMLGASTRKDDNFSNIKDEFPNFPGTSSDTGGRISNVRDEFPSLPSTSTCRRGHFANFREEFPSLPSPSRNSDFPNLPIPGRGRGKPRKKE